MIDNFNNNGFSINQQNVENKIKPKCLTFYGRNFTQAKVFFSIGSLFTRVLKNKDKESYSSMSLFKLKKDFTIANNFSFEIQDKDDYSYFIPMFDFSVKKEKNRKVSVHLFNHELFLKESGLKEENLHRKINIIINNAIN